MAIDSVAERFSMMQFGQEEIVLLEPDNLISAGDRLHFLLLYSGIDAAESESGVTEYDVFADNYSATTTITDSTSSTDLTVIGPNHFVLKGRADTFTFTIRIHEGSSVDLSGFQVEALTSEDGQWQVMQTTWGTTDDEDGFVVYTNTVLETLTHDSSGIAMLAPRAIWALRFKSKLASVPAEAVTRSLEISATQR